MYGHKAILLLSMLSTATTALVQEGRDFRAFRGGSAPGVIDIGAMVSDGDVRTFDMYMREGTDMPGNTVRGRTRINCRDRTETIVAVARQSAADTDFDITRNVNEPWDKADVDETGALIVNLVCAQAADRDRYARRLPANDWHGALVAASNEKGE